VPLFGNIISVILQMITFGLLSICLLRRTQNITSWTNLPLATWLVLIIYADSALFVFVTSIITQGIGINESHGVCKGGILLCLVCYMTTKILIYYFLVERAYIIRGCRAPRLKTKLWLFNCLGMIVPYCTVVVLNFVFRIAYINEKGVCIIGMEKKAMLPLISFDVVVNVSQALTRRIHILMYGTDLYSYQHNTNRTLRTMAYRSFIGSCASLTSSVANLTVLMVLKGEPGWICLMLCNADVLFAVIVLHWMTQVERSPGNSSNPSQGDRRVSGVDDNKRNSITPERPNRGSLHMWTGSRIALPAPSASFKGTMSTEIKAAQRIQREGSDEDTIELRGIRVQTERTQEAQETDVDVRGETSAEYTRYGQSVVERRVTVENMV
ncbi:hypothetical protein BU23DRAFT_474075, partial [Bimuria novae-zelandiae CBS 107.79]